MADPAVSPSHLGICQIRPHREQPVLYPVYTIPYILPRTYCNRCRLLLRAYQRQDYPSLVMEDIGWLGVEKICGRGLEARAQKAAWEPGFGGPSVEFLKLVSEVGRKYDVG